MNVQRADFEIRQGSSLLKTLIVQENVGGVLEVFDLTGYEARLMIREKLTDSSPVIALYSDALLGTGLTITAVDGLIEVEIPPTQTSVLDFRLAIYDLEIYTALDAEVYRILEGFITLSKESTK